MSLTNPSESEHWLSRWLTNPYEMVLRTLGQTDEPSLNPQPSDPAEPPSSDTAPLNTQPDTPPQSATPNVAQPSVALLIDGENCASSVAAQVVAKAKEFGDVRVRRVYANWTIGSTRSWIDPIARYAIQPIHHEPTTTGKNATDILLTIDAMDLLHSHAIDCFCLVASDSDYTPLIHRLRAAQRTVVLIGRTQTLPSLVQMSNVFISLEDLTESPAPTKATPAPAVAPPPPAKTTPAPAVAPPPPAKTTPAPAVAPPPAKADPTPAIAPPKQTTVSPTATKVGSPQPSVSQPKEMSSIEPILIAVWEEVQRVRGTVSLSNFINAIKQLHPHLKPEGYGHAKFAQLIKQRNDLFRLEPDSQNPSHMMVLRTQPTPTQATPSAPTTPPKPTKKAAPSRIRTLLEQAWQQAPKENGWMTMSTIGQQLKQIDPKFTSKQYGHSRLTLLLQAHTDLFELKKVNAGQYRLRKK
ncbi:NYN domain-containing protein [Candidatus Oscillochloris fontis]|uniref:NYN domain-containing protein n=1 Tax=Candidatus Oscillochloris fontis TaxID=2496868 RepID=UPI001375F103|nr:NYN domain-containing protein [Candidatus Oscillochloris fontis]